MRKTNGGFAQVVVIVLVVSVAINLLVLTSPIYMMQVFDRVLPTRSTDTLVYLSLIALAAVLVLGLLDGLRQSISVGMAQWWEQRIRPAVLDLALASARRGDPRPAGAFADIAAVRAAVAGPAIVPVFDAPWMPLYLAAIWMLHPMLGVTALAAAIVLAGLAFLNEIATRRLVAGNNQEQRSLDAEAQQFLRGADAVAAMGMATTVATRQFDGHAAQLRSFGRAGRVGGMIAGLGKGLRFAVQIAILGLGALLVLRGELTAGGMIAASIILGRALAPVEQLTGSYRTLISARQAHRRLKQLIASAPAGAEPMLLPAPRGEVRLEAVTYVPAGGGKPVVEGVSFTLEPGTALGLIGPSGSGKTTLCRMIVGAIAPTRGAVRIDGTEVGHWNPDQLGRAVGYVPQTLDLFAGTVRQNIARFTDAPDPAVTAAAELAGCHAMIAGLPRGYDTELGDGGRLLSGGERQRIALARALFGDPRLLVLDEATAFLDAEGEAALLQAVATLRLRGASVIVVTHRPSLLGPINKVAILQKGRLTAFGDRDAILKQLRLVADATPPVPAAPPAAEEWAQ